MSATEVVNEFIAAWNDMDWDKVTSMVTEDCIYHNIPMEPVRGPEGVRAVIDMLEGLTSVNWQTLNIAENGNVVLTERIDDFVMGGRQLSLPVMGTFEVREGKISAWRDYFDLTSWVNQVSGAV